MIITKIDFTLPTETELLKIACKEQSSVQCPICSSGIEITYKKDQDVLVAPMITELMRCAKCELHFPETKHIIH